MKVSSIISLICNFEAPELSIGDVFKFSLSGNCWLFRRYLRLCINILIQNIETSSNGIPMSKDIKQAFL